ncbi:MAG: DUF4412 domain-containing protein [Candidatus Scalinduaceae bacterium]
MKIIVTGVLFATLICSNSFAGVIITTENRGLEGTPPEITTSKIYIEGKKMRIDTNASQTMSGHSMIYRGDLNLIWNIDEDRKKYIEMDKNTVDAMGSQISQAMKQMQESMAQMPPEQRKMMESMMKGTMPQMQPKKATTMIENTGKKDKINGYSCTWYDVLLNGEKVREMCVSNLSEIGIKKETLNVFKDMSRFFSGITEAMKSSPMSQMNENPFSEFEKLEGYPIIVRRYKGSTVIEESSFKSIEHKKINKTFFEIPSGYTKQGFGMGMGR